MLLKVLYVSKDNEYLYADLLDPCTGKISSKVPWDAVVLAKKNGTPFENVIFQKNGFIRATNGSHIQRVVLSNSKDITTRNKKVDLSRYRNNKLYDGRTPKYGVTINGHDYIVKGKKGDKCDTSVYSEYVASHFINNLGFQAHETSLVRSIEGTVVLMRDFTSNGSVLIKFKDTNQSSEDTDLSGKMYTYEDVLYLLSKHTKIPESLKSYSNECFWTMFFLDGILGNRDRHHGNWGYLNVNGKYRLAPLYDNGGCLFPGVFRKFEEYHKDKVSFLLLRSGRFPASLLGVVNEEGELRRTNYHDFVNKSNLTKYPEMLEAYWKIKDIGISAIFNAIQNAVNNDLIPENLRKFYIEVVCCRYMHIVNRVNLTKLEELLKSGFPWR